MDRCLASERERDELRRRLDGAYSNINDLRCRLDLIKSCIDEAVDLAVDAEHEANAAISAATGGGHP